MRCGDAEHRRTARNRTAATPEERAGFAGARFREADPPPRSTSREAASGTKSG